MKLSRFKVLSGGEIARIHEATLDILANCGVMIDSPEMLSALEASQ